MNESGNQKILQIAVIYGVAMTAVVLIGLFVAGILPLWITALAIAADGLFSFLMLRSMRSRRSEWG